MGFPNFSEIPLDILFGDFVEKDCSETWLQCYHDGNHLLLVLNDAFFGDPQALVNLRLFNIFNHLEYILMALFHIEPSFFSNVWLAIEHYA